MFDDERKQKIIASFDEKRGATLDVIRKILNFPFHPDTQLILFEIQGYSGSFGLTPFAMKDSDYDIDEDAFGTPLYQTQFGKFSFGFSAYNHLDEVKQMSSEEIGELDDLAIDCLCEWFANLYHEVSGSSPISCMIQIHDTTGVYSLKEREWLTEEEFEDYFEDEKG
jgi:hypothetical protein